MTTYKNILLGYDDSKFSKAALAETLSWAKAHNSKVTLVHAVYFDSEEFSIKPSQIEQRLADGKAACELAVESYSDEMCMNIEYLIRQGEPHEVITAVAREIEADLIAVGTHGRRGLRRMIMGSVTSGVILDSPCDVLVVKKPCEECNGQYHRILVPYDDSELSHKAISRVKEITDTEEPSVTILYVIPEYREMLEIIKTKSVEEMIHEEATRIVLAGENLATEAGISANTMIEEGSAADKIVETAGGLGSDLIIMGSHGWRGIDKTIVGSTTQRVIAHSQVPILIVK